MKGKRRYYAGLTMVVKTFDVKLENMAITYDIKNEILVRSCFFLSMQLT